MIRRLAILLAVLVPIGANAHDQWADGTPVPGWVKQYCCGPDDVHRLTVAQIQHVPGGWRVDGFDSVIPDERVIGSLLLDFFGAQRHFALILTPGWSPFVYVALIGSGVKHPHELILTRP